MKKQKRITIWVLIALHYFATSCQERDLKQQFYESDKLELEYQSLDGKKDGFYKVYYENGDLKYEGKYVSGLKSGWHILYYLGGVPNQKSLWENRASTEVATRKEKYDDHGRLVADFAFAINQAEAKILSGTPCYVGDTILVKLKLVNAELPYAESAIGEFDYNLNILEYSGDPPSYIQGNSLHEMFYRFQFEKSGIDTIRWLIRNYDFRKNSDSTTTRYGTESYFQYPVTVIDR